jgi:GNAT superfamily N-acetyltransferase
MMAFMVDFRRMTPDDIASGLALCRAAGWNQLDPDWRCFLDANPTGCRVAITGGEVAGTVATLRFEDRFSWISMVLVAPELRGRGIGTGLLMEALRVLDDMPCVRLDATPAGKLVYDKCGFHEEYGLVRMFGTPEAGECGGARPMRDADFRRVLGLDREIFGADRRVVLDHLRGSAPQFAFVAEANGEIAGFVFGRRGFRADQIGPVIARDQTMARALVSAVVTAQPDRPWIIDAAEHSAEWSRWLESCGFRRERPFLRMYRGTPPAYGIPEHQFAIAGPEFG